MVDMPSYFGTMRGGVCSPRVPSSVGNSNGTPPPTPTLYNASLIRALLFSRRVCFAGSLFSFIYFPINAKRLSSLLLQEGDSSMSGSIEWEDFLIMMKPVVEQEYRRDAEAMLKDTPVACREAAEVRK